MTLFDFLDRNPKHSIPFWPGARTTTPFGVRKSKEVLEAGGSPLHLGKDRAGGPNRRLLMPFTGTATWRRWDGLQWGSCLQLVPDEYPYLEIQVAHTSCDRSPLVWEAHYNKGEELPFKPDQLGFSFGIHTHTEVVLPLLDDTLHWLRGQSVYIYKDKQFAAERMKHAATRIGYPPRAMLDAAEEQVRTWGIHEMYQIHAVRIGVPEYRTPNWGPGPTIHVDPGWLLDI